MIDPRARYRKIVEDNENMIKFISRFDKETPLKDLIKLLTSEINEANIKIKHFEQMMNHGVKF